MCLKTPKPPKESQDAKAARAAQLKSELDERTRLKTEATETERLLQAGFGRRSLITGTGGGRGYPLGR
tara:strand:- start:74 stop:277 length:204 start_codon:yes stop_codon:yes gene_type:complete